MSFVGLNPKLEKIIFSSLLVNRDNFETEL